MLICQARMSQYIILIKFHHGGTTPPEICVHGGIIRNVSKDVTIFRPEDIQAEIDISQNLTGTILKSFIATL
jgi:hypothetical protein